MTLPKFVFVHIPKSGGTTLREIIKGVYKDTYLLDRGSWSKRNGVIKINYNNDKYPKKYKSYYIIHSHSSMKRYEHLNWKMITLLRHPIKRLISEYSMISHYSPKFFKKYEDIVDFCYKEDRVNFLSKMSGGDLDKFDFVGITEKYDQSIEMFSKFLGIVIPTYKKLNVTPVKLNIDKKYITKLKDINKQDIDLYNLANRRYR